MQDQHKFIVDTSAWPIVSITYPPVPTVESIAQFVRQIDAVMADAKRRRAHVAGVADLSQLRITAATSETRAALAEGLAELDAKYPNLAVCDAVISQSPMVRGLVAAHSALRMRRNHITRTFSCRAEAMSWASLTLHSSQRRAGVIHGHA